jgi:hypothetical protein
MDQSYIFESAAIAISNAASNIECRINTAVDMICEQMMRPSTLLKPNIVRDGNAWCASIGSNPMEGVYAFGDSPEDAMKNFDKEWVKPIEKRCNCGTVIDTGISGCVISGMCEACLDSVQ